MSDFVFKLDTDVASTAGNGGAPFGVLDSGIYDVEVVHATLGKTDKGNNKLDLAIKCANGHTTTIYQAFVLDQKWISGAENFGYKDWMAFAVVAGLQSVTTFQKPLMKEDGVTPVLKNGSPVVLNAVKELEGKKLKLAIVKSLDVFNNEVTEKNEVFASFTVDGLNANEKTNSLPSSALEKLSSRIADKKSKKYKTFLADGGVEDSVEESAPATSEELGL